MRKAVVLIISSLRVIKRRFIFHFMRLEIVQRKKDVMSIREKEITVHLYSRFLFLFLGIL